MEPDRYVKIKDRSKDVIISGGENISSHRGRGRAVPPPGGAGLRGGGPARPEMGRDAGGLCRDQARREVTAEELVAHCKGLLAGYKVPREIRFEPIPKTSTGKIQKFQLRERAKSAIGDRKEATP
jgi:fatty-acyl-CoA synthase